MHKLRSDTTCLKSLFQCPNYHQGYLTELQELPLIYLDTRKARIMADEAVKDVGKAAAELCRAREGVYLLDTLDEQSDKVMSVYSRLNRVDGCLVMDTFLHMEEAAMCSYLTSFLVDPVKINYNAKPFRVPYDMSIRADICSMDYAKHLKDRLKNSGQALSDTLRILVEVVGGLNLWLKTHTEIRAVATRNVAPSGKSKAARKKPWLREDLVEVRFLDRLPSPPCEPSGGVSDGTRASPRRHFRQATRRTLRHPRYKNHPLYQVEGGVEAKSSWVGQRQVVVNGVEYRVMGD